ncbi:MAG TPA: response regulator transcription factor [Burkholderiales bacterium]|nr:response regulator transcription factor [Burkholderiales bacterium]
MSQLKVFLIDDNTLFLVAASRFLIDFCKVKVVGVAQSVAEALQKIPEAAPDLVLLDQTMPGTSGLDAVSTIKKLPEHPAVILVTLNADSATREEALRAGCDGFVSKIDFTAELPPLLEAHARRMGDGG